MMRTLVTALVAVAAVAAASLAYAAIPSGNGVISACKTKDGAIKVIDKEAGESCPGQQQLVAWTSGCDSSARASTTSSRRPPPSPQSRWES